MSTTTRIRCFLTDCKDGMLIYKHVVRRMLMNYGRAGPALPAAAAEQQEV